MGSFFGYVWICIDSFANHSYSFACHDLSPFPLVWLRSFPFRSSERFCGCTQKITHPPSPLFCCAVITTLTSRTLCQRGSKYRFLFPAHVHVPSTVFFPTHAHVPTTRICALTACDDVSSYYYGSILYLTASRPRDAH